MQEKLFLEELNSCNQNNNYLFFCKTSLKTRASYLNWVKIVVKFKSDLFYESKKIKFYFLIKFMY